MGKTCKSEKQALRVVEVMLIFEERSQYDFWHITRVQRTERPCHNKILASQSTDLCEQGFPVCTCKTN